LANQIADFRPVTGISEKFSRRNFIFPWFLRIPRLSAPEPELEPRFQEPEPRFHGTGRNCCTSDPHFLSIHISKHLAFSGVLLLTERGDDFLLLYHHFYTTKDIESFSLNK
jgi:hypothetical protein